MSAGLSEQQPLVAAGTPAADTPPPDTLYAPSAPPPPRHGLPKSGIVALAASPFAFLALAWGGGVAVYSRLEDPAPPPLVEPIAAAGPTGAHLYGTHCARCHGETGDGRGSVPIDPPARAFGLEKFRFATAVNENKEAIPTDDDLHGILRRGIPGTSMPAFDFLAERDRSAIIDHVRVLTRAGLYERLYREGMKRYDDGDDDLPVPAVLAEQAYKLSLPGKPLDPPGEFGPPTPEQVAGGRAVYEKSCQSCHGPQGAGDGPQVNDLKDERGRPIRPRNLTAGVYKGGGDSAHLAARILLGIPGTPMPATPLTPQELRDLVQYVRSLAPANGPAFRQEQTTLRGPEVSEGLASSPR